MTIRTSILLCFLSTSTLLMGQNALKEKRFEINELNLQLGYTGGELVNLSVEDFKTLAPNSYLINEDISGFNQNQGIMGGPHNSIYTGSIGVIRKSSKGQKIIPQMRFGVNYTNRTLFSNGLSWSKSTHYDTVTLKNGESIYMDSTSTKSHSMYYSSENLRLDASLIFRFNPTGRWSFFAGLGLVSGISINAKTRLLYYESERFITKYPNNYASSTWIENPEARQKNEEFKAKTNFMTSLSCPLGVDFRIIKKPGFWHNVHVFYELRPSINFTRIPELRTFTYANSQNGIGIRLTFD